MLVVAALSRALAQASAQAPCQDYLEYWTQMLSDDDATRETAELQRRAQDCLGVLTMIPHDKLAEVFALAERALDSREEGVRVYATGLFGFVTMFRPDVGGLVSKYLPALEKRYTDPGGKVRSNAVSAVINIKPRPPVEAAEALVGALDDSRTRDNAFAGLVLIAPIPEWLAQRLVAEIDRTKDFVVRGNLLRTFGQIHGEVREEIIASLLSGLRSPEQPVVEGALSAIAQLGTRAAATSSELRRLAHENKDEKIAKSALHLAERLGGPK
jgi:hypothetical protein